MKKLLLFFGKINFFLEKILYISSIVMLLFFIILIIYQVISRNVSFIPVIQWTEEISRFSFMWMIILGATFGVLRSNHFMIDIFENTGKGKKVILLIREILILTVLLVFIIGGMKFGISGTRRRSIAAGVPMWMLYISFFTMGIFGSIFSIYRLLLLFLPGLKAIEQLNTGEIIKVSQNKLDKYGV